ncbi:MAG: ROK family protein [Candidatus Fimousia sp.]
MAYKSDDLKQFHVQKIKDYFYDHHEGSKALLSEETGISKTTCTTILKEMEAQGFLMQKACYASTGGRPGKQYQLNKDYQHSCLIDIKNGKYVQIIIEVRNLYSEIIKTNWGEFQEFKLEYLYQMLDEIMAQDSFVSVIAVSIPGVVDQNGSIGQCDIKTLEKQNLKTILEEKWDVKVVVENDVNLAVVGYHQGEESLVFLYQPQCMYSGCGIMLNHCLYRGNTLFAGEVGYLASCFGRQPEDRGSAKELLIHQLVALICILNPKTIAICSFYGFEITEITEELKKYIDRNHFPELLIEENMESYILKGLMEASIDIQRNHFKIKQVRKV